MLVYEGGCSVLVDVVELVEQKFDDEQKGGKKV